MSEVGELEVLSELLRAERVAHEATRVAFEGRIEVLLNESKAGWAMAEHQRVKAARLREVLADTWRVASLALASLGITGQDVATAASVVADALTDTAP